MPKLEGRERRPHSQIRVLFVAIYSFFALIISHAAGQAVIENPDKPVAKNAGRTIALKEILKITDESGEFFFKFPSGMKEGPDGSLYLRDNEQILRFDANGKFVRNYFKKGQGPGEMISTIAIFPTETGLCIQSRNPQKIVLFDDGGTLIRESAFRPKSRTSMILYGILNGTYYFSAMEMPINSGEDRYIDHPYALVGWTEVNEVPKNLAEFPVRSFIVPSGSGGGGTIPIAQFMAVPYGARSFVVVHTSEYLIKIFDVGAGITTRAQVRKYPRVESPPPTEAEKRPILIINNREIPYPRQKFLNDISNIIVQGDRIWIVTSTKDAKKGTLIDVFDASGKYIDAFYLNFPSSNYSICGSHFYTAEKTPDETYVIKKYQIEWRD